MLGGGIFWPPYILEGEHMKTVVSVAAGQEIVQNYGPQTVYTASFFTLWSVHCPGHRFTPIQATKSRLNQRADDGFNLKPHELSLLGDKDIVVTGLDENLVADDADLAYLIVAYGDAGPHEWPNGEIF